MNVVIESFLKNHINEYELEFDPQKSFEHLINYIILRNLTSRHFDPEIIGTDDGEVGIDGFAIVINDTIVTSLDEAEGIFNSKTKDISVDYVFTQSKTSESFEGDKISLFLLAVKNFFGPQSERIKMNDKMDELARVSDYIFENAYKLNPNPICSMYYASNGVWTDAPALKSIVSQYVKELEDLHLFSEVSFVPFDQKRIINAYRQIRNSVKKQIYIDQSATIPAIQNVEEAYVGIVKCKEFIELISDSDGRLMVNLFEDNVRYFQGYNTVNLEIADTLSDPELQKGFALLNNGVTVVAKEIRRTGNTYTLSDFQIVNGCQTSFMLYNNRKSIADGTTMIMKLVATKDNELTGNIVKATNRQTPVQTEAFETLREFHRNLEQAYASYDADFRLYYERRSKQYDAVDINKNKIISFPVQIYCYVAMFLGEPQSTHRYYGEILEANSKRMFREDDILQQYCISAIYLSCVEKWLKEHHKEKYKPFKYHIVLLMRCLVDNTRLPRANSNNMNKLCKKLYNALKDAEVFQDTISKAIQAIDQTCYNMKERIHEPKNYPRSRDFTKEMIRCIGIEPQNMWQEIQVKEIKPGEVFTCKVIGNNYCFAFVEIIDHREPGQIHISELANQYVHNIGDIVHKGDTITAKVLDIQKHPVYGYSMSKKRVEVN